MKRDIDKIYVKGVQKQIGTALRTLRMNRAMTREEVSRLSGLSHSVIYSIEHGKSNFTVNTLTRILKAMGYEYIFGYQDDGTIALQEKEDR